LKELLDDKKAEQTVRNILTPVYTRTNQSRKLTDAEKAAQTDAAAHAKDIVENARRKASVEYGAGVR